MTVKEFVNKYNKAKDKEQCVKNIITVDYLPYVTKIAIATRITKAATSSGTNPEMFEINTPMKQMLFLLSMVDEYTDIEIDWKNLIEDFDDLSKTKLIGLIMKEIPESEVSICSSVLDMTFDDYLTNNRDLVAYLDTKFTALKLMLDTMSEAFNSEQIQDLIGKFSSDM